MTTQTTIQMYRIEFRKGGRDYWRHLGVTPFRSCADHLAGWFQQQRPATEVRIVPFSTDAAELANDPGHCNDPDAEVNRSSSDDFRRQGHDE